MSSSAPARRDQGGHDAGHEVEHGGHGSHEAVVVNGVSSDDEPSVAWGWHGHYPKIARFAGFICAAVCLILLHGNHVGKQEDVWLVVLAVVFAGLSIGNIVRGRAAWRR